MTILDDITDIEDKYKSLTDFLREMDRNPSLTSVAEMELFYHKFPEFCQSSLAINILYENSFILERVPTEKLNEVICTGEHAGKSAIYGLMKHPLGLQTLIQRASVLDKITADTLNHVISSGDEEGFSPVYWLSVYYEGKRILDNFPSLVTKISKTSFNAPIKNGPLVMSSPFSVLFSCSEGLCTLDNPHLLSCITKDSLNRVLPKPQNRYPISDSDTHSIAPVQAVAFNKQLMEFFINNLDIFLDLISPDHLNNIVPYTGESLLHTLFQNESFIYNLAYPSRNPHSPNEDQVSKFLSKITAESFNRSRQDRHELGFCAPCSLLCSTDEGCRLLKSYPLLIPLFREDTFNLGYWAGKAEDGMSAAYHLASKNLGLAIYEKYPHLVNLINEQGWNSFPDQGDNEGIKLSQWVMSGINHEYYLADEPGVDILRNKLAERNRAIANDNSTDIVIPVAVSLTSSSRREPRTNVVIEDESNNQYASALTRHGLCAEVSRTSNAQIGDSEEDSVDDMSDLSL